MKKVLRFDSFRLDETKLDQNGYLEAKAAVTRTGVFVYRYPDGSVTRELRHPDDVLKADSLATLKNRPVTFGHPVERRLTPKNTRKYAVGNVVGDVTHDSNGIVMTRVQITDADAIAAVTDEKNPVREMSCGYESLVVKEDGEYNGQKYDHRHTNIVYNHVAIVQRGRAGAEVKLQLDAADAVQEMHLDASDTGDFIEVDLDSSQYENERVTTRDVQGVEGVQMIYACASDEKTIRKFVFDKSKGWTLDKAKDWSQNHRNDSVDTLELIKSAPRAPAMKIKIKRDAKKTKTFKADVIDVVLDVADPAAIEKTFEDMTARIDSAVNQIGVLEEKNDELVAAGVKKDAQIKELQAKVDAAESNKITAKQLGEMVAERTTALAAAKHLKIDGAESMETPAIKKAVVMKAFGESMKSMKPEDVTDVYISGRYDSVCDMMKNDEKSLQSLSSLRSVADPTATQQTRIDAAPVVHPRQAFLNDTAEMWRDPQPAKAS